MLFYFPTRLLSFVSINLRYFIKVHQIISLKAPTEVLALNVYFNLKVSSGLFSIARN